MTEVCKVFHSWCWPAGGQCWFLGPLAEGPKVSQSWCLPAGAWGLGLVSPWADA